MVTLVHSIVLNTLNLLKDSILKVSNIKPNYYLCCWGYLPPPQLYNGVSLVVQVVKNPPALPETWARSLGWEDPLEKGMATLSSILAWRIPRTEDPGGLLSMGSQRGRHDWMTNSFTDSLIKYILNNNDLKVKITLWSMGCRIDVLASMKTTLTLKISISLEPNALSMNSNILKGIFFLSSRSQQ